jgi:hypothetical protein
MEFKIIGVDEGKPFELTAPTQHGQQVCVDRDDECHGMTYAEVRRCAKYDGSTGYCPFLD